MSEAEYQPKVKEIRKLICKGCKSEIDEMGCVIGCKYDVMNFGSRDPVTMQRLVYVFNRVEPYSTQKSKRNKNDEEELEGVIVYLDPTNLHIQVGEILRNGYTFIFRVDKITNQLKEGQKVMFQLDKKGAAVRVKPVL